jgi:hypothetical protein
MFDLLRLQGARRRIRFAEERPIILYSPHFAKGVSSWHRWGVDVVECFYRSNRLNLIFPPRLMLFERPQRNYLPAKYRGADNTHIDTGSLASTDMTYILAPDIYLGDVSSPVYVFLCRPRPCVFLNANDVAWRDDPDYHLYA